MTADREPVQLTERIAQAVAGVPGVAFLRPGLAGLLRSSVAARAAGRRVNPEECRAKSAVRVGQAGAPGTLAIEVSVVLRRGHRAVDVTREVRAAVWRTVQAGAGNRPPARITVTVTGLV
ncbi:Asp23/Gls24 family envelope stress response protein (plasmid) [Streptomyces sp. R39]|uniref:Asp23/Gls24 family envelope stress response protein n=1 Tax=Streptomyces sp. R39 TaxID=3238631 RepID=A0AB39R8X5_9ACTN